MPGLLDLLVTLCLSTALASRRTDGASGPSCLARSRALGCIAVLPSTALFRWHSGACLAPGDEQDEMEQPGWERS